MATTEYSKIIMNEDKQSAIPGLNRNITAEEYYDIMHHTHNMSDLISDVEEEEQNNTSTTPSLNITDDMTDAEKIEVLSTALASIQETIGDIETAIEGLSSGSGNTEVVPEQQQDPTNNDNTQQQDP